ncbi:entericidin EcnA/B family protein [Sphingomonas cavernae]|uniref:Entericidin EcnA/B family protein n=1 Tax=Sphingomonas cavernae TaxID=2320861 RepID=A0A418WPL6_9SPHN|nr:entericidin EcnA/B family protein [Sphingomonas cavernae]RJF93176.1 entericidin EcnA/B family protein [Sphingomonas cavernae]
MKNFAFALALLGALTIAACNTVSGAGDDIQSASNAVENEMD